MLKRSNGILYLWGVGIFIAGADCNQPPTDKDQIVQTPATPDPAVTQSAPSADPPQVTVEWPDVEPKGWLWIERIRRGAEGAHATGQFIKPNKIVIETQDVDQFAVDLSAIPIDWNRRVVLRINGDASELTRKHFPRLRMSRSPTGGWIAQDKD